MRRHAIVGILLAVLLGTWLRTHGLSIQVVQDDEWHAIHKLMASSYGEILRSFGLSDHSIPLTVFYKWMAGAIGLDEIDMRIVQVLCGVALIAACGALAWIATGNPALATLFAVLVAGAPFLVFYSRYARPYAITTLLSVVVLAALWRWRARRTVWLGGAICLVAGLAAWLHPLAALFPMAGLLFVLGDDLRNVRSNASAAASTAALGVGAGLSIVAPLAVPLLNDMGSLAAKAGDSAPTLYTLSRVVSLFAGGLPDGATVIVALVAAWGAWRAVQTNRGLGAYLLAVTIIPLLVVVALRGSWTHQGHTFARYVFPAQVIFLFWFSFGTIDIARRGAARAGSMVQPFIAGVVAALYLAFNPAIAQVLELGPWYGHIYHQYDYVDRHNRALHYYDGWRVPDFYRKLGALPAGSVTIIQAPFNFVAPYNPDAFYAHFHRQHELQGFVHDLCLQGPRYGEVPRDPRFRFRSFVFLDDQEAVARSGAQYLLLQQEQLNGAPFQRSSACLEALEARYGPPVERDGGLAVFDLRAAGGGVKLQ